MSAVASDREAVTSSPLDALRARRLARRVKSIDRFDVFYQAYVTVLVSGIVVLAASDWIGGVPVATPTGELARRGAAVLGFVTATAVAAGLRSGSRGGPLALEPPDIRHVLLAPVPRSDALRAPALRQLRFLLAAAVATGATGGQLAARRLPGPALGWMASGTAWAVVTVVLAVGVGWLAAGQRMSPWLATGLSTLLVGAATAEVAGVLPAAPSHWVGGLAVLPVRVDPWSVALMPLAALVLAVWAMRGLGGSSVEHLGRRSALVGQLRFAATMRDLRTVMLVRRQLHQEAPRSRPWLPTRRRGGHTVVVLRDWRALLRTPMSRLLRLFGLTTAAAAAAVGMWLGTPALIVVAGICAFLAALEALEPLAQEVDRCTLLDLSPVDKGAVLVRHLVVPVAALSVLALVTAGATLPFSSNPAAAVAVTTALVAPVAAVAGAAINVLRDGDGPGAQAIEQLMLPPEAVGMRLVYKLAFPPAVAAAGFVPVLFARQAVENGTDPAGAATSAGVLVLLVAAAVAAWVRHRESLSSSLSSAMASADATREGVTR